MNYYSENMEANKEAPASWCVLPWSQMSINGNGVYRPCCNAFVNGKRVLLEKTDGKVMRIQDTSFDDVINSSIMRSMRLKMLQGKWPKECSRCEKEFKENTNPMNMRMRSGLSLCVEREDYPDFKKAKALTRNDGSISLKDFPVLFMDIRFGNLCNLKCLMCGPADSSMWYKDYSAVTGKKYFNDAGQKIDLTEKQIFDWSQDSFFLSQVGEHRPSFRKVNIVGGEPLIIKAHYDFLERCVEQGVASKIYLTYNSNITVIPQFVWDLWRNFKEINMNLSVDGFGSVNEFIRYPSKWSKIEKNLQKFDTAKGNFCFQIATCISVLNIWHLPEFIFYIMKRNHLQIGMPNRIIEHQPVHGPERFNISILPDSFKQCLRERFNEYKEKIASFDWLTVCGDSNAGEWDEKVKRACEILDSYIGFMNLKQFDREQISLHRKLFVDRMDKLDKLRGTCWSKTLPELYKHTAEWRKIEWPPHLATQLSKKTSQRQ